MKLEDANTVSLLLVALNEVVEMREVLRTCEPIGDDTFVGLFMGAGLIEPPDCSSCDAGCDVDAETAELILNAVDVILRARIEALMADHGKRVQVSVSVTMEE